MSTPPRTKSLRRRLFGSHLLVMGVALGVLALVVGLVALVAGWRSLGPDRSSDGGPLPLVIGLSAAATASGLVSWRLTRRLAAPIEGASEATRDLAEGRYDVRVARADTTEMDSLAVAVNQLAHTLQTTEQRRLRLIGDVAHELRNPLSTIEGTMEALLDGVVAADDNTYARVGREAARLRRLADDLSSLSSAGEQGLMAHSTVDVASVARDVVAQLEPQAAAKNLELSFDSPASSHITGDIDRITQVFINVVGNAVQYTEAGSITMTITNEPGFVRTEVADTGRGLAEADQARVFERFHRVDEHYTDGTGVGLAIAKLITEAHGGTITASSPGLGRGTTVRIDLPSTSKMGAPVSGNSQ